MGDMQFSRARAVENWPFSALRGVELALESTPEPAVWNIEVFKDGESNEPTAAAVGRDPGVLCLGVADIKVATSRRKNRMRVRIAAHRSPLERQIVFHLADSLISASLGGNLLQW